MVKFRGCKDIKFYNINYSLIKKNLKIIHGLFYKTLILTRIQDLHKEYSLNENK